MTMIRIALIAAASSVIVTTQAAPPSPAVSGGPAVTAGPPATFTLTANAIGTQVNDTTCLFFSVDQTGTQTATTPNTCW